MDYSWLISDNSTPLRKKREWERERWLWHCSPSWGILNLVTLLNNAIYSMCRAGLEPGSPANRLHHLTSSNMFKLQYFSCGSHLRGGSKQAKQLQFPSESSVLGRNPGKHLPGSCPMTGWGWEDAQEPLKGSAQVHEASGGFRAAFEAPIAPGACFYL